MHELDFDFAHFNSQYTIAAIAFGIIMIIFLSVRYPKNNMTLNAFRRFTVMTVLAAFFDVLASFCEFNGEDIPYMVNLFMNVLSLGATTFATYAYTLYVDSYVSNPKFRGLSRLNSGILFVQCVALLSNFVYPLYIGIDARGHLIKGMFYFVGVYGVPLFFVLCGTFVLMLHYRSYPKRIFIYLVISVVLTVVVMLLQIKMENAIIFSFFVAILAMFVLLLALETPDYYRLLETHEKLEISQKEAEEARKVAEQASEAKSQFLANMSHEIRTPMNTILGMDEMILRESENTTVVEYAQNIQHAGNTLLHIINDILDFSKIESGKMEIEYETYHLSEILHDITTMIRIQSDEKKLDFKYKIDDTLPDTLSGDEIRLKQILINILNNAVKYTDVGQVLFEVSGERVIQDDKPYLSLLFVITDTGRGIGSGQISTIFDSFERLEENKNHKIEGTGLGLTITKNLIELMGGTITVESEPNRGSTFRVELKQEILSEVTMFEYAQDHRGVGEEYNQKFVAPEVKILAVDDNEMNLMVVTSLLKSTQAQITVAHSGYQCLEKMKMEHYDVILLDHMMPGIDGVETLYQSKELEDNKCLNTPVIVLTANAIAGMKEKYLAAGFSDYLAKPVKGEDLEEMLLKYLPKEKVHIQEEKVEEYVPIMESKFMEDEEKSSAAQEENEPKDVLISKKDGMSFFGNNEKLYLDLVKMYADLSEQKRGEIEEDYEKEDWKSYTIHVHALKSSSKNIGALMVFDLARRMEAAAHQMENEKNRDYSLKFIKSNHNEMLRLFDETVAEAKKMLE